jgi:cell division protein FtsB
LEGIRFTNFTRQVDFLSKQLEETRAENEELRTQIKQLYEQNLAISNKLSYVQSLLDKTHFHVEVETIPDADK